MNWDSFPTIRIPANGIEFEVAVLGSGDRVALCLHGFPEHAYSWRYQMPLLAKLGYRVWTPNLRGYGQTDSPQQISAYRIETLVQDIVALIKASRAEEVLLMGHDWGGALAWLVAMYYPALLTRLVILNLPHPACFARELTRPSQFFRSWYMLFFQIPKLPELLLSRNGAYAIGRMIRRSLRDPSRFSDDALEVYCRNALRPGGLTSMLNWYRALLRGGTPKRFYRGPFPFIHTPTLFLWGDADSALSIQTTRGSDQHVSDLTFRVLPGVSHWIQQDAPDEVNAMLAAWLSGAPVPEYAELRQRS